MTRKEKFSFIDNLNVNARKVHMTVGKCVKDFYNVFCMTCVVFHNLSLLYVHSLPSNEFVKISFDVDVFFSKGLQHVSFYYPFDKFMMFYESGVF